MTLFTSLEICAGAGGQALGLEQAGFEHIALVEIEPLACQTLRLNRPEWKVINEDLRQFSGKPYSGQIDLLAGGVPCPPFSVAGKQLGSEDERDLFPEALRLAAECRPKAGSDGTGSRSPPGSSRVERCLRPSVSSDGTERT